MKGKGYEYSNVHPSFNLLRKTQVDTNSLVKWLSFQRLKKYMTLWTKKKTDTSLTNHVNNTIITKTEATSPQSYHLSLVPHYLIA